MKRRLSASLQVVATAAVLLALCGSTKGEESFLLDPAEGRIDSYRAMVVYPYQLIDGHRTLIDPSGFETVLIPHDPAGQYSVPAGQWSSPEPGWYRFWVEGIDSSGTMLMSQGPAFMHWTKTQKPGPGSSKLLRVGPAGRVRLPDGLQLSASHELRLLRAEKHIADSAAGEERLLRPLSRRSRIAEIGDGIFMPVGRVVALVWSGDRYIMISRPFQVDPDKTVEAPVSPQPTDTSALIIQGQRLDGVSTPGVGVADETGFSHQADLVTETASYVYYFWWSLPRGSLRVESQVFPTGDRLRSEGGQIHRLNLSLGGSGLPSPPEPLQ